MSGASLTTDTSSIRGRAGLDEALWSAGAVNGEIRLGFRR